MYGQIADLRFSSYFVLLCGISGGGTTEVAGLAAILEDVKSPDHN